MMPKKRIIGAVIVKDGLAVQSFNFRRYLPIGSPVELIENLDRWGADEILLLDIDRSRRDLGPNLDLLSAVSRSRLRTPLIYGGGIKTLQDAILTVQTGADRIAVDSLLHSNLSSLSKISSTLGAQSIVASIPASKKCQHLAWFNSRDGSDTPMNECNLQFLDPKTVSEVLLIDHRNEGLPGTFEHTLLDSFPSDLPIIAFGGLSTSSSLKSLIDHPSVSAAAFGNILSYKEHSLQSIKALLAGYNVRTPYFCKNLY